MFNKQLSDKVEVPQNDTLVNILKSAGKADELAEVGRGKVWTGTVAKIAAAGVPDDLETAYKRIEDLEIAIRVGLAIPSARPGGARSMGTGFKLDPTFKAYKSVIKGAYENGVELLDAAGVPRSYSDITDDIKEAKALVKEDEDKIAGCVDTLIKVHAKCNPADPRTVDADNTLLNWLRARGYEVTFPVPAAA